MGRAISIGKRSECCLFFLLSCRRIILPQTMACQVLLNRNLHVASCWRHWTVITFKPVRWNPYENFIIFFPNVSCVKFDEAFIASRLQEEISLYLQSLNYKLWCVLRKNQNQNQLSQQINCTFHESTHLSKWSVSHIYLTRSVRSEPSEYSFHERKHILSTFCFSPFSART